jgi:DNA-directed RNA polymerase I, II, and III subunit RPABC2
LPKIKKIEVDMADDLEENPDMGYEQEEWAEEYAECLLDYVAQVLPKMQLAVLPPGGVSSDPEKPTTDPNHRTYPFLTNFERTKIIGLRSNQISKGSAPFISVPSHITDVRDIARMELDQKRLPYIVKRPLPDGTFEYWRLADLLILQ